MLAFRVEQRTLFEVGKRRQRPHLGGLVWVGSRDRNLNRRTFAAAGTPIRTHRRDIEHKWPDAHARSGGILWGRRHWRLVGQRQLCRSPRSGKAPPAPPRDWRILHKIAANRREVARALPGPRRAPDASTPTATRRIVTSPALVRRLCLAIPQVCTWSDRLRCCPNASGHRRRQIPLARPECIHTWGRYELVSGLQAGRTPRRPTRWAHGIRHLKSSRRGGSACHKRAIRHRCHTRVRLGGTDARNRRARTARARHRSP